MIIEGNGNTFEELIGEGTVLIDFFATWCGPCKMLSPVLHELAEETGMKVVKIDIDENQELAIQNGVMSVPTMQLYTNGTLKATSVGYKDKASIQKWIEENK